ncbi:uncharacterized protein B0H18DRAFT_684616 [Fomitopsis serialis]|uniref:uncharacterized protein n=1 Tax=Fomitopsis serialis TaxID=139415 RepID=UPI0020071E1D|nr:uncharacterized protein B0H18DRAFT_684616 [Neoantrodia serialis]KAH9918014.1 hypothetical protein B0H18DRAFT_684616 [Neoantrodia serialis]
MPGYQMTGVVDGADRLLEGHDQYLDSCFRPPTYSNNTYPRFPPELIDHIFEILRYDPFTLTRCRFICHAWYHAAKRLFWGSWLELGTREVLDDCVHMFLSNGNRPYGKTFTSLKIVEDPQRPFIRVFPMCIPGYILPRLTSLGIEDFDCAVARPHDRFFHSLSYYTGITRLGITQCCFRSMAELRRISNALPSLEHLSLWDVTLQHPLVPDPVTRYVPSYRNKLKRIGLGTYHPTSESAAHLYEHGRLLLDVCATYPYVTELELDLRCYSSFSHLHRVLSHFSHLSNLSLRNAFGPHVEPASMADMTLYTAHAPNPSLSTFGLVYVPQLWASQLLKLWSTPQVCSQLEVIWLDFTAIEDAPCADLGPHVTEVLRLAGTALKTLELECYLANGYDVVPRLTANTALTMLTVHFRAVEPSLPRIQRALCILLSDIRSSHLGRLRITINLSHSETSEYGDEVLVSETDSPSFTFDFQSVLSRGVFHRLPAHSEQDEAGVVIQVQTDSEEIQIATMSAIKSYMINLFAPWLDREVLRLHFIPDPDGELSVTRDPSSVLGTHTSITKIQDAGDDESGGNVCDASGDTDVISPGPIDGALGVAGLTSDYQVVNNRTRRAPL